MTIFFPPLLWSSIENIISLSTSKFIVFRFFSLFSFSTWFREYIFWSKCIVDKSEKEFFPLFRGKKIEILIEIFFFLFAAYCIWEQKKILMELFDDKRNGILTTFLSSNALHIIYLLCFIYSYFFVVLRWLRSEKNPWTEWTSCWNLH